MFQKTANVNMPWGTLKGITFIREMSFHAKYYELTPTRLALCAVTPSALSQNMVRYATISIVQLACPLNPGHTCTSDTTAAAGISTQLLIFMLGCFCVMHVV